MGRVDIITSTLGKALGGASGGFASASPAIVAWLRQRARPYLFSNSVSPIVAAVTLRVLQLIEEEPALRSAVHVNAARFRGGLATAGFELRPGEHPIIPVMLGDAALAAQMADRLLDHGVYVIGFSYPVVPMGTARIRTQMSSALTAADIDAAVAAFTAVGDDLGVIQARR
jgi:glycine C-acetyltransferase